MGNAGKELKQHFLSEAQRMQAIRMDYYSEPDLSEYMYSDTEMTKDFFNLLSHVRFNMEWIVKVCFERLSDPFYYGAIEKKQLQEELDNLIYFSMTFAGYKSFIDEKAYYYAAVWEELDEVRESGKGTTETG